MNITRRQLNDSALKVDSAVRSRAINETLKQSFDWYGRTPGYVATFHCIHQCIDPETTTHYSWEEWFLAIATNTTYKLDPGSFRRRRVA